MENGEEEAIVHMIKEKLSIARIGMKFTISFLWSNYRQQEA